MKLFVDIIKRYKIQKKILWNLRRFWTFNDFEVYFGVRKYDVIFLTHVSPIFYFYAFWKHPIILYSYSNKNFDSFI